MEEKSIIESQGSKTRDIAFKYGYAQYWSIYCLGSIDCPLYR